METRRPLTEVPCSGLVDAKDPIAWRELVGLNVYLEGGIVVAHLNHPFLSKSKSQRFTIFWRMDINFLPLGRIRVSQRRSQSPHL